MYRITIVDNDVQFVDFMKEMIIRCPIEKEDVIFEEFYSKEEFVSRLNVMTSCDLLILDEQIEEMEGHETAKIFRKRFPHSVLVFCSASRPTNESFKATPFRYLSKNYEEQVMLEEMDAVIRHMQSAVNPPVIIGNNHGNLVSLYPDDITYIENRKAGSIIHLCEDRISDIKYQVNTKRKLADIYQDFKDCQFEYAHNSYLVNLRYVKTLFSQGYIQLKDGTELNVARSKRKKFQKAFAELLSKKYDYE